MENRGDQRVQVKRRVEDLLETYAGEWMSVSRLTLEYERRFGPVNPESVRRAVKRLAGRSTSSIRIRHRLEGDVPVVEACHPGYSPLDESVAP